MILKNLNKLPKLNTVSSEQIITNSINNSSENSITNLTLNSTIINKIKSDPISIKSSKINNTQINSTLSEDSLLYNNHDAINKKYETCGCIIISELDILENIINDKYIQLCKSHYKKHIEKSSYYYNKKNNKYIYNYNRLSKSLNNNNSNNSNSTNGSNSYNSINNNNVNISKSYENLQGLLYNNLNKLNSLHNQLDKGLNIVKNSNFNTLVSFGKYKDKSYEYVYYNDKLYCYNLAFWNIKEFKNKKIINFIKFIKEQLLLESI